MLRFNPINDEDRIAMLSIFIVTNSEALRQIKEAADDWYLVGSMIMERRGVWNYGFLHPVNCTMYSHSMGIRRILTSEEYIALGNELRDG
jgi:hypothetical protein